MADANAETVTAPESFDKRLERWLDRILPGAVRNNIDGEPALYRWLVLPIPFLKRAVVIHEFVADDDLVPHLHPRSFISIGFRGGYVDVVTLDGTETERLWKAPWFRRYRAGTTHRVRLVGGKPCWTLCIK